MATKAVIEIRSPNEIHFNGLIQVYAAEPSVESAVQQFIEKWKQEPVMIYKKNGRTGRVSIYIPVEGELEELLVRVLEKEVRR